MKKHVDRWKKPTPPITVSQSYSTRVIGQNNHLLEESASPQSWSWTQRDLLKTSGPLEIQECYQRPYTFFKLQLRCIDNNRCIKSNSKKLWHFWENKQISRKKHTPFLSQSNLSLFNKVLMKCQHRLESYWFACSLVK